MNARAYFTILRPWRTLVVALPYLGMIHFWLRMVFRVPAPETLFLGLAFFGPVIMGTLTLGPLHEVMHRSTFPLLPGARRQLSRWHLRALALIGLCFLIPAVLFVETIPTPALLGLITASFSLPLLNRRRRLLVHFRHFHLLLIALGILLATIGYGPVGTLCRTAPWVILAGGLGFAALGFRFGFSAQNTRNSWRDPMQFCLQSTLPFCSNDVVLHVQAQFTQLVHERNNTPARDWAIAHVGSSMRDWIRVVHHARFGQMSRARLFGRLTLAGILLMPLILGVFFIASKIVSHDTLFADIYRMLVSTIPVDGLTRQPPIGMVIILSPLAAYGFALLAAANAATPALPFPIARDRLARSLFLDAARLATGVYAANFLGTALGLFAASRIAGEPFGDGVLAQLVAAYAVLPSTLLFGLGYLSVRSGIVRLIAAIAFGLIGVLAVVGANLYGTAFLLSPIGLLVCAATTAGSVWLSWLAFRRHYRACDLNQAGAWLRQLGLGLA